jgi:hypothetical protein
MKSPPSLVLLARRPGHVPGVAGAKSLPGSARSRLPVDGFEFDLRRVALARRRLLEGRLDVCSERVADALLARAAETLRGSARILPGQPEEISDWLMLSQ